MSFFYSVVRRYYRRQWVPGLATRQARKVDTEMKTTSCTKCGKGLRIAGRGTTNLAQWLAPGAILVFLPKCPACLAGYVALWSGVGLSLSVASGIRHSLIVVSAGMLLILAARLVRKYAARRRLNEA